MNYLKEKIFPKQSKNTRIIILLIILLALIPILVPPTYSLFSKSNSIKNNIISTGSLDISFLPLSDRKIMTVTGDTEIQTIIIKNTGTLDINNKISISTLSEECKDSSMLVTDSNNTELYNGLIKDFSYSPAALKPTDEMQFRLKLIPKDHSQNLSCNLTLLANAWPSNIETPDEAYVDEAEQKLSLSYFKVVEDKPATDKTESSSDESKTTEDISDTTQEPSTNTNEEIKDETLENPAEN